MVRHIRRRHMQCVGQTLRIQSQMSLDPRNFLARVILLSGSPYPCSSRSLHPRYKSSSSPYRQIACGPRQRIFLSLLLKFSPPLAPVSHSRSQNIHGRCATSKSLPGAFAIDTHCTVRRARTKHLIPIHVARLGLHARRRQERTNARKLLARDNTRVLMPHASLLFNPEGLPRHPEFILNRFLDIGSTYAPSPPWDK